MTTLEFILSWLLLIVPGLYLASRGERPTLEKILRVLTIYIPLAALFYFLQPFILVKLQNTGTAIGAASAPAAAWWVVLIVMSAFALGGLLMWKILKLTRWWQAGSLIAMVVIAASAVLIYYLRPGWGGAYHTNYVIFFCLEWLFILVVTAIACWKSGPQKIFAIPASHFVAIGMTLLLYYIFYGINLATKIMVEGVGVGFLIIVSLYAGFATYNFLFTKGQKWSERVAYKIHWVYIFGGTLVATVFLLMYIVGAYNQIEWETKVALNNGYYRLLVAKLRNIQNKYAYQAAKRLITNPLASQVDIANAVTLLEKASVELEETVANAPALKPTYNEKKLNKSSPAKIIRWAKSIVSTEPYNQTITFDPGSFEELKYTKKFKDSRDLMIKVTRGPVKVVFGNNVSAELPVGEHPAEVKKGQILNFESLGESVITISDAI
ncbi:MAG: hypothetical protein ABIE43_04700 [Patescibacteria group bacterium]